MMKESPKLLSLAAGSGAFAMALLIGNVAQASCGSAPPAVNRHSGVRLGPQFHPADLVQTSFEEGWEQGSIVGLGEFEAHLKGAGTRMAAKSSFPRLDHRASAM
jgi:hypothetical protein